VRRRLRETTVQRRILPFGTVSSLADLSLAAWALLEEAELARVLGHSYETYRCGRARLIPRVW
jgi:hypothetical protein